MPPQKIPQFPSASLAANIEGCPKNKQTSISDCYELSNIYIDTGKTFTI